MNAMIFMMLYGDFEKETSMSMRRAVISVFVLITLSFVFIGAVSAQSINVLGEVRATGEVFIESSNGQWLSAPSSYPLLQNTGIKTGNGSASLFFKDGSRVDIAKDSLALVDGSPSQYSMQLSKGILAFNIMPSASLTVQTPTAVISANKKSSPVQMVSAEKTGRVLGVISASEKGTEIRSISGRLAVDGSASETKMISTGESLFIDANSNYNIYKTQAVKGGSSPAVTSTTGVSQGAIAGAIASAELATAVIISGSENCWFDGCGHKRRASPSGF